MERVDKIMKHPLFQQCREVIDQAEVNRIYCKHNLEHSLDVARIAYILNLEEKESLEKELIYAMALVHDLGRSEEYINGTNHHVAGAEIAKQLLEECGFSAKEIHMVCQAVAAHKSWSDAGHDTNAEEQQRTVEYCKKLLYRADKLSRNCYDCSASKTCYWDENIRNHQVLY